ncbi:MAG: hypothetical protein HYX71_10120 [Opitutae bacterium]|nr:hypothetical protein [Opitutae bacterium]
MKNLLKSASLLLALAMAAVPALRAENAPAGKPEHKREHGPGGGRRGPEQRWKHMAQELGLSADQQAKWKAIGEQEKAALGALRDDTSVDKKDRRAKAQEINKPFADQRRAVLTADQAKKFDEMREKMRDRMEERREHGPKAEKRADK